jgi:hypothetical protein
MAVGFIVKKTLQLEEFKPIEATGGTIIDIEIQDIEYRIHSFTQTGTSTFEIQSIGTTNGEMDILLVAGGGGGGSGQAISSSARMGAGGGAGGLIFTENFEVIPGSYSVAIGSGGAGGNASGSTFEVIAGKQGSNSSLFGLTAIGGGRGAQARSQDVPGGVSATATVLAGGSGGGVSHVSGSAVGGNGVQPSQSGISGSNGFGNKAGDDTGATTGGGSGGGGAGSVGGNAGFDSSTGGNGGIGRFYGDFFTNTFGESG